MSYTVHTIDSAPAAAKEILIDAQQTFGFVPNLYAVMAEAPAVLSAYTVLSRIFEDTSLTITERQVVLLTASYVNNCGYCIAAHTTIAGMQKVSSDVVKAIRDGQPIVDRKLEALRRFTAAVVVTRGWPTELETQAMLTAGYGPKQVLEVILGIGIKTLSNYVNSVGKTPLDQAFVPAAWSKAG